MIVIYRACPVGSLKNRPISDKLELVETCFKSFLKAFGGVDYELNVLIDKPNKEIRDIFKGFDIEETYYTSFDEGNTKSFHRQIEIALEHEGKFLFCEDDYYWLPEAGKIISQIDLPFFTPYDHPNYYLASKHLDRKESVLMNGGWHWRTIDSTTLTFGGQVEELRKEADLIRSYGWADEPMWNDIIQRVSLFAPVPTLATHMETEWLSPKVDWFKYF